MDSKASIACPTRHRQTRQTCDSGNQQYRKLHLAPLLWTRSGSRKSARRHTASFGDLTQRVDCARIVRLQHHQLPRRVRHRITTVLSHSEKTHSSEAVERLAQEVNPATAQICQLDEPQRQVVVLRSIGRSQRNPTPAWSGSLASELNRILAQCVPVGGNGFRVQRCGFMRRG
jgi:hypothetical protein